MNLYEVVILVFEKASFCKLGGHQQKFRELMRLFSAFYTMRLFSAVRVMRCNELVSMFLFVLRSMIRNPVLSKTNASKLNRRQEPGSPSQPPCTSMCKSHHLEIGNYNKGSDVGL